MSQRDVAGSPLTLPDGAWGKRWFVFKRRHSSRRPPVSVGQSGIACLLMLQGLAGLLVPLGVIVPLNQFVPNYMLWIQVPGSIALFILGVAVGRDLIPTIRKSLALVMVLSATSRVAWLFNPSPLQDDWRISSPLALMLATVGIGLFLARDWGRRGCIVLGLVLCAHEARSFVRALSGASDGGADTKELVIASTIAVLLTLTPYVALMIYGALKSTRRHFAETREAIARAGGLSS